MAQKVGNLDNVNEERVWEGGRNTESMWRPCSRGGHCLPQRSYEASTGGYTQDTVKSSEAQPRNQRVNAGRVPYL